VVHLTRLPVGLAEDADGAVEAAGGKLSAIWGEVDIKHAANEVSVDNEGAVELAHIKRVQV
jgi:hypothetical protein